MAVILNTFNQYKLCRKTLKPYQFHHHAPLDWILGHVLKVTP